MWKCGLVWGIGGGPFLCQIKGYPVMGENVQYDSLHWATRVEGMEACWRKDTDKSNTAVQMTLAHGLHHCTIFTWRTPPTARKWVIWLGNSENNSATCITFLEKMISTAEVEVGFAAKKKESQWTVESVGQSVLDGYKRVFMQASFPERWTSIRQYEFCQSLYSSMCRQDASPQKNVKNLYFIKMLLDLVKENVNLKDLSIN